MATRSTIGYFDDTTEKYHSIYCHWDGYLEGVGKTLKDHYKTIERVKELVTLGSISVLAENINPTIATHSFDKPEKNVTVAYHRDRKENWKTVQPEISTVCYRVRDDFAYLFKDGQWLFKSSTMKKWTPIPD